MRVGNVHSLEMTALTPVPAAGSLLTLQGAGAYDAAVHCASVSAARRIMQHQGSVASSPRYMGSSGGSPFTGRRGGAPSGLSPTSDPRIQRPQSGGQASQGQRQGSGDDGAGGSSRRPAAPNMFQKVEKPRLRLSHCVLFFSMLLNE